MASKGARLNATTKPFSSPAPGSRGHQNGPFHDHTYEAEKVGKLRLSDSNTKPHQNSGYSNGPKQGEQKTSREERQGGDLSGKKNKQRGRHSRRGALVADLKQRVDALVSEAGYELVARQVASHAPRFATRPNSKPELSVIQGRRGSSIAPPLPRKAPKKYSERRDKSESAIDFVRRVYKAWVKPKTPQEIAALARAYGADTCVLHRGILRQLDEKADTAIENWTMYNGDLPPALFLPTKGFVERAIIQFAPDVALSSPRLARRAADAARKAEAATL
jgi:hypothetical protein